MLIFAPLIQRTSSPCQIWSNIVPTSIETGTARNGPTYGIRSTKQPIPYVMALLTAIYATSPIKFPHFLRSITKIEIIIPWFRYCSW